MTTLFKGSSELQSLKDDLGPGAATMTVTAGQLEIFGSANVETMQPKTTKDEEQLTVVAASHESGEEEEDWRRRLHSLEQCVCELLIRNQELRMSLLGLATSPGRATNRYDEFVREY